MATGDARRVWDLWLDLALGSVCAACGHPGRALCHGCRAELPRAAYETRPDPCPSGLLPVRTAGEYAGALRALVVAHKEHRRLALAGPLGGLLAGAVQALLRDAEVAAGERVLLVPVPSRRAVVASRGHDPLLRIARSAAQRLRREGVPAGTLQALRQVARPVDQAGLDAAARRANVDGSLALRPRAVPAGRLVLVDDVITTGATLREAQRALEASRVCPPLVGAATVAATRRRGRAGRPVLPVHTEGG